MGKRRRCHDSPHLAPYSSLETSEGKYPAPSQVGGGGALRRRIQALCIMGIKLRARVSFFKNQMLANQATTGRALKRGICGESCTGAQQSCLLNSPRPRRSIL